MWIKHATITAFLRNEGFAIRTIFLLGGLIFFLVWLGLPVDPVFDTGYSQVVHDVNGSVLRVTLARDQQLRFASYGQPLSTKYVALLKLYEDRRFEDHAGIDFPARLIAAVSNPLKLRSIPFTRYGRFISLSP